MHGGLYSKVEPVQMREVTLSISRGASLASNSCLLQQENERLTSNHLQLFVLFYFSGDKGDFLYTIVLIDD